MIIESSHHIEVELALFSMSNATIFRRVLDCLVRSVDTKYRSQKNVPAGCLDGEFLEWSDLYIFRCRGLREDECFDVYSNLVT